jgi:hypothetical protein
MKTLHFDSTGGAAGDMILGALIALGADLKAVTGQLRGLVDEEFSITVVPYESHGIQGVRAQVECHDHQHNTHHHAHEHHHHHRTWAMIRGMIERSSLPDEVKAESCAVFEQIARAEGLIHGKNPDEVHFHEVGALDSIIDIAGCCCAKALLGVDRVAVGPLPVGCGTMECQHGIYPLPAPATQELLNGMCIVRTDEPHELVTPTGAALLRVWCGGQTVRDAQQIGGKAVYSFGMRALEKRPNVLRAVLMERTDADSDETACAVLEANLDDTNPELLGALLGALHERGALDAFYTPVQMKKQRPGTLLTVLCRPAAVAALEELIFRESTTFGIRRRYEQRSLLKRTIGTVGTEYGTIRVKNGSRNGEVLTRAPEMDDCMGAARRADVSVRCVYEAALNATFNENEKHKKGEVP